MLKLEPYETCPIANRCEYRYEVFDGRRICGGCDPSRVTTFVCDLYTPKDGLMSLISECLNEK